MVTKVRLYSALAAATLLLAGAPSAQAVTFTDIATGGGAGLTYTRQPSARLATLNGYYADGRIQVFEEYIIAPVKAHGAPGVALLDFDGDGDLDIYVTNGPGRANSLFANQLRQTGRMRFVDVAAIAGVTATDQDSQGVCYGDIDNDGDPDLLVLGMMQTNRLFRNRGNGTFADISASSGLAGLTPYSATSCAMGDVNGDGRLDVYIANAFDFTEQLPFTAVPFDLNQPDQLLINQGNLTFADASAASGIRTLIDVPAGAATIDWAVTLVDFDQDGDLDAVVGNDHRGFAPPDLAGYVRFLENDGNGHFTDSTADAGLNQLGSYRGFSVGDLNCDGRLDLFASNMGPYIFFPGAFPPDFWASKWFFGQADGTWVSPGPGALVTVPTGWGNSMFDYDNDGDLDLVVYGGQDTPLFVDASNPGVILKNDGNCSGTFSWDQAALAGSSDHIGRNEEGLAVGDLNLDGFPDVVSVSGMDLGPNPPLAPFFGNPVGSIFDDTGLGVFTTVPDPDDPAAFLWTGYSPVNGSLSVEINSGNSNRWVRVDTQGSVGLVSGAKVNRDGIGALVSFTPRPGNGAGKKVTRPVAGGSSYASQDSTTLLFGLGNARLGDIDVAWPGGVKNRLYGALAGESITFPEIPCSYAGDWPNRTAYLRCVLRSLDDLVDRGKLGPIAAARFLASAVLAYEEQHDADR